MLILSVPPQRVGQQAADEDVAAADGACRERDEDEHPDLCTQEESPVSQSPVSPSPVGPLHARGEHRCPQGLAGFSRDEGEHPDRRVEDGERERGLPEVDEDVPVHLR